MHSAQAKSVVGAYFHRLLNEHDLAVCDELLASDYVDHDAAPDTPPGPASTKRFVAEFLATCPDVRLTIDDLLAEASAEGARVAARLRWRGTHRVTGAPYRLSGIAVVHLDHRGRFVERWSAYTPRP